jgi:nitrogen-specific signal transduction histidine kinase
MLSHFVVVIVLTVLLRRFALFSWQHVFVWIVVAALYARIIFRFALIPKIDIPSKYGVIMAVIMLTLALSTEIQYSILSYTGSRLYLMCISLILMVTVIFLTVLFFRLVREFEEKSDFILLNHNIDMQKKTLEESTEIYNSMRQLRHELKNHLFYMNTLLSQERFEELKKYFKQIYSEEYKFDMIESGNNIINTLLNQKLAYAKSKNIHVAVNATLPESLGIDDSHVCAVISNLFDNAIEACGHLPNAEIAIALHQKGKYLLITTQNTVAFDVLKDNAALASTKKLSYHGIGLQVVNSVVNDYDGAIDFYMENMTFVVNVMLRTNL